MVFISKGKYGKTPMDGLAVGQFVQSPEGKSMFESFGNWNFDNVYIDARANEEQREALKEIASHLFPPPAKERKFHFVNISRTLKGAEHEITVSTNGGFSGHLISGAMVRVRRSPMCRWRIRRIGSFCRVKPCN